MQTPEALESLDRRIVSVLARHPEIRLAFLFGSLARGTARPASDVDLGVVADVPLGAEQKSALIEDIALASGRSVDLVDLQTASGLVLQEALTKGRRLLLSDRALFAGLMARMWADEADFQPYRRRILEARRKAWISG